VGTALFGPGLRSIAERRNLLTGTRIHKEEGMKLTPLDIQRHEFQQRTFRGLDRAEVRMFLNAVSEEMEHLRSDNEKMSEEVRRLTALLSEHHQREEILKNTLVAAQRTSEELKENAKKQSQMLSRKPSSPTVSSRRAVGLTTSRRTSSS
jgi:DivIVA domain-containing protein